MPEYNPKEIEKKWQEEWEKSEIYKASDFDSKPKYYALMEFPYPSGDGLHTGHVRGYTAMDIVSRKRRMQGHNVMFPIGYDAFGLPTENFALKTGRPPAEITKENCANFEKQFKRLGMSFDWSREVNTTDPKYYKWTQWIFLKLLENNLAYKAKIAINWCPKDKIGLANEEVVNGCCERCGTPVEQREKEQWMLKITAYADRLLSDLDTVDYPERVKTQQRNWIGKSEGALIKFDDIEVFTTRPDTIYGATFLVKAGKEDKFTGKYVTNPATGDKIPVWEAEYVYADYGTGAIMAVPAHDERDYEFAKKHDLPIKQVVKPIFIGVDSPPKEGAKDTERNAVIMLVKHWSEDKYLLDYSPEFKWKCLLTGGVEEGEDPLETVRREIQEEVGYKNIKSINYIPLEHIDKFYAPHKEVNRTVYQKNVVVELADGEMLERTEEEKQLHQPSWCTAEEMRERITLPNHLFVFETALNHGKPILREGVLMNSSEFDGLTTEKAREVMTTKFGVVKTTYKLRDWVFSRQRYWGEPIPVVHCEKDGIVPLSEKDLPLVLPEVKNYQPTDTGESPLANIHEWVNTTCPKCGGPAKRETDTMPNWAGSSWYFLRYTDPKNDEEFAAQDKLKYWTPVDWYNGGMEHTVLHLLYSRFWHKFLFDQGLVPTSEPYKKRTSHGLILAEGGVKMSKSLGNVINPDAIVEGFGADTLRLYEMFMGPFEQAIEWNEKSLVGPRRFLERIWKIREKISGSGTSPLTHQTIKKVSDDIEVLGFNTAVSTLMIYTNELEKREQVSREEYETLLKLLAPFAPHMTEELWHVMGNTESIHTTLWPAYDESKLVAETVTMVVQVDGKVRGKFTVASSISEAEAVTQARSLPEIAKWVGDKEPAKTVFVPGKLVNFVLSEPKLDTA